MKSTGPVISVITAACNSAATLEDTLCSVLGQDYTNVEHIVVDGGSTDGTVELLTKYLPAYETAGKRLVWTSEADKGIYDAINKGIAMAKGEIVGALNADDFFTSPDILSKVAGAFAQDGASAINAPNAINAADATDAANISNGVDAVYGDVHYVHPSDLTRPIRRYSSRRFRRWQMRMGFMPAHPSFYCRKTLYEQYGSYDPSYSVAGDFELLLRFIFKHRINCRYLPVDFVTMRTGGASSSGMGSHRRIFKEHRRAYRQNGIASNFLLEGVRYLWKLPTALLMAIRCR